MTPREQIVRLLREICAYPDADQQKAIEELWVQMRDEGINESWFRLATDLCTGSHLAGPIHITPAWNSRLPDDMILVDENWTHGEFYTRIHCAIRGLLLRFKSRIHARRQADWIFH